MWIGALAATLVCATIAAAAIDFMIPVLVALSAVILIALSVVHRYTKGTLSGKKLEIISAVWTLTLYSMLGLVPLLLR